MKNKDIKCLLPHRYPFLFIDKVIEINKIENKIIAIKNLSNSDMVFNGHFPDYPIFPGVLLIECGAQASTILLNRITNNDEINYPLLTSINNAKFKKPCFPGDTLQIISVLKKIRGKFGICNCKVFTNNILCTSFEITFSWK